MDVYMHDQGKPVNAALPYLVRKNMKVNNEIEQKRTIGRVRPRLLVYLAYTQPFSVQPYTIMRYDVIVSDGFWLSRPGNLSTT